MSLSASLTPLEVVRSDVWGPSPIISSNGNQYYVSFIDDFSKLTWLFLLHRNPMLPLLLKNLFLLRKINSLKY